MRMYDAVLGDGTAANTGILPITRANMPTSGSSTYHGYAIMDVELTPVKNILLIGTSKLTAGFATGVVTGAASGFYGVATTGVPGPLYTDTPMPYQGTLTLSNGCTGAKPGCSVTDVAQFTGTMAGTLTGAGNTITTSNTLSGQFYANPGPRSVYARGIDSSTQLNGAPNTSLLQLLGTR